MTCSLVDMVMMKTESLLKYLTDQNSSVIYRTSYAVLKVYRKKQLRKQLFFLFQSDTCIRHIFMEVRVFSDQDKTGTAEFE